MQITQSTCLDKQIFTTNNIRIIGQANKELILVVLLESKSSPTTPLLGTSSSSSSSIVALPSRPLLIAFDQHAVHERIRFEKLMAASFNATTGDLAIRRITPPIEYRITPLEWQQISRMLPHLERIVGLKCELKHEKMFEIEYDTTASKEAIMPTKSSSQSMARDSTKKSTNNSGSGAKSQESLKTVNKVCYKFKNT